MADRPMGTWWQALEKIENQDAEIAKLRADLARVTAERDGALASYRVSEHQREEACCDRDRAMAERDVARRDRDARPEISREDAERIVSWMHATILENADSAVNPPLWVYRLREALRALTAGSGYTFIGHESSPLTTDMLTTIGVKTGSGGGGSDV